jgi:hypothetical protein
MEILIWLQNWFLSQCDGDWEHDYGITIKTLGNPGWSVKINIEETEMDDIPLERIEIERSENDWVHCRVEKKTFKAYGGPENLKEMLEIFRNWVERETGEGNGGNVVNPQIRNS